ncbi:MAG TPA: hypothetical protein VFP72_12920, partial [Kineosporiaceae bacterium]|nr:hypothetical protein [Kineosporiaceae bacterium]
MGHEIEATDKRGKDGPRLHLCPSKVKTNPEVSRAAQNVGDGQETAFRLPATAGSITWGALHEPPTRVTARSLPTAAQKDGEGQDTDARRPIPVDTAGPQLTPSKVDSIPVSSIAVQRLLEAQLTALNPRFGTRTGSDQVRPSKAAVR